MLEILWVVVGSCLEIRDLLMLEYFIYSIFSIAYLNIDTSDHSYL
jgi:hypothetical protein